MLSKFVHKQIVNNYFKVDIMYPYMPNISLVRSNIIALLFFFLYNDNLYTFFAVLKKHIQYHELN